MDTNRLVNIIFTDLTLDNLKVQEELDRVINSTEDINTKVQTFKTQLEKLAINELMLTKLQSMVQPDKTNQTQEDGKI